jgi:acetylornithine deacetylase/succinyl-diaminopimelate desuccinylase-like protein
MSTVSARDAQNWAIAHQDSLLETLRRFVAIPSVSTDPSFSDGIAQGAAFLANFLMECGFEHASIEPTGGHPVVRADWLHAEEKPTILVYGHYDVQPPDPLDAWASPPFEATLKDNRLYGRGVSDDKGPMIAALGALAAYLGATGNLPVNIKLLFEGEEEVSSANLDQFVADHADELAADFVLSADGAMWRVDLPTVTTACRGLCALEIKVSGAAKDLHSGRHGGAVANPLQGLAHLLAALHASDGSVSVPGFYDGIEEPDQKTRASIAALPFDEDAYLRSVGAPEGVGEAGWSLLERNWLRPTLEINGISGGYSGPGKKTVIPAEARAKISCRLVPGQDPVDILNKVERAVLNACPRGVSVSVEREKGIAHPFAISRQHPALQLAMQVLEEIYGQPAQPVRMGATIPIGQIFAQRLGLGTVFFSFSTADEDYHAPNEFFRVERMHDGIRAWIRIVELVATLPKAAFRDFKQTCSQ